MRYDVMKIEFFGTFFQRSSRLIKVMVKLWGGVSILNEGGDANVYPFIDFLLILLDFIDLYRFY